MIWILAKVGLRPFPRYCYFVYHVHSASKPIQWTCSVYFLTCTQTTYMPHVGHWITLNCFISDSNIQTYFKISQQFSQSVKWKLYALLKRLATVAKNASSLTHFKFLIILRDITSLFSFGWWEICSFKSRVRRKKIKPVRMSQFGLVH